MYFYVVSIFVDLLLIGTYELRGLFAAQLADFEPTPGDFHRKMISAGVIAHVHVEWGCGAAAFDVAANRKAFWVVDVAK